MRGAKEHEERRRITDNPSEVNNVSRWVQEMGWAKHFDGKGQNDDTSGKSDAEGVQGTAAGTTESNFERGGPATGVVGGQF